MHNNSNYYRDMLSNIREQIADEIISVLEKLGGKVCPRHYHDECCVDRYTFFDITGKGYGVELHLETVEIENGNLIAHLVDTEDSYDYEWNLADFNASNSLYLLQELEEIANYVEESGEPVVTEYKEE